MADRSVILALARVIVAAAWADGELHAEEIDSLKDLLFHLPHVGPARGVELPAADWARLDMYIQSPVDAAERNRLIAELQDALRTPADRELALAALDNLLHADGVVVDAEREVMQEIRAALQAVDLGVIAQIARLIRGPVRRRSAAIAGAPNREDAFEDFVKNRIYYLVRERLRLGNADLAIPDADVRKLSLAGGLMARIANIDRTVTGEEREAMMAVLQTDWGVSQVVAALVAEVAVSAVANDLDYFRLTRAFFSSTDGDERTHFLDVLFDVAYADGRLSSEEHEEIRRIAQSLNLSQRQVNDAREHATRRRMGGASM
jgi:uncharacterized tellurite resistance protein B-like protein